ncbi:MAG: protease modulator HflC [Thiohalocapsa sp.]|jgi:membrane protease subunit HflC|uniref:protease modulator HflC n=1 Tax=Thiohalocapsa sp. TaxID=2497641 RepID=UPI0025D21E76|nr:protease modulator HflC [Thiohalocapsa sp.]MCG6943234.1 protease modulator HflC [Thiohalocapsa sp.]
MDDFKKILVPVAVALLVLLVYASTFTVKQYETAIKLRLGEIVGSDYKPGLHFKVPLLNNILKFDARIQTLDARPGRFLTIEKKDVIVDSYTKWRISNAAQFFRSTGGDSARTARLLSERINTSLRDEFGKRTIQEVVSEDRLELMTELTKQIDTQASELGVDVVDVRVKKIDLPPEVSESVYNRMRAERERVARDLRAKGSEAAERIRADADRQRTVILADAYREAEETRGQGDGKAAGIYAKAYQADPEFYAFYRSLNAYVESFGKGDTTLVLAPDSEFFRFFSDKEGRLKDSTPSVEPPQAATAVPAPGLSARLSPPMPYD